MAGYVQAVIDAISDLDHKVVLVGHSLAGAIISNVAEIVPERIERLVYLAAFLLKSGDTILEAMQRDSGEMHARFLMLNVKSYLPTVAGHFHHKT